MTYFGDFYAAGLLPVVRQFGREFFRVCWLLSDKNLNALKTSRYKTFLCRLRLNSLLLSKNFDFLKELPCQSGESNPRAPSPKIDALPYELLGLWYETMEILRFIFYILSNYAFVCKKRKSSEGLVTTTLSDLVERGRSIWHLSTTNK